MYTVVTRCSSRRQRSYSVGGSACVGKRMSPCLLHVDEAAPMPRLQHPGRPGTRFSTSGTPALAAERPEGQEMMRSSSSQRHQMCQTDAWRRIYTYILVLGGLVKSSTACKPVLMHTLRVAGPEAEPWKEACRQGATAGFPRQEKLYSRCPPSL